MVERVHVATLRRRRMVMGVVAALVCTPLTTRLSTWLQGSLRIDDAGATLIALTATAVPVYVLLTLFDGRLWPRDPATVQLLARDDARRIQRHRFRFAVRSCLLLGCTLLSHLNLLIWPVTGSQQGRDPQGLLLPIWAIVFIREIFGVQFGRHARSVLNDELTRFLRARALAVGYAVTLITLSLVYVGSLYRRDCASFGLPVVLFLAVAVPTLWFAVLERRAGEPD